MIEIIFLIVLLSSLAGILIIVYEKAPLISEMPDSLSVELNVKKSFNKIKESLPFQDFSFESFLQKILSRTRILVLKIENQISALLQKLRQKAKEKKSEELNNETSSVSIKNAWQDDNYWQKVKKFKKKKP